MRKFIAHSFSSEFGGEVPKSDIKFYFMLQFHGLFCTKSHARAGSFYPIWWVIPKNVTRSSDRMHKMSVESGVGR